MKGRNKVKRLISLILALAMIVTTNPLINNFNMVKANDDQPYVISKGRMVYSSSSRDNNHAENAVDGSYASRWESEWQVDPQWFYVDLGKVAQVTGIAIDWKGAYAKEYKIQLSNDEENWTDVYATSVCTGGKEKYEISGSARYVRIYMTKRALTAYGYSFNEFEVYGLDGITKRPVDYGTNLALNKTTYTSGIRITDSMYDEEGNLNDSSVRADNAVDGIPTTKWVSSYEDNQWISVDLGESFEIGRICVDWTNDSGKIYDIQVSQDNDNWTTIYRQLKGYANEKVNLQIYANARYVRVYGYTRSNTGNGFNINELQVYKYVTGEEKKTYSILPLPETEVIAAKNGMGSYITKSMYLEKAKLPTYISEEVEVPIATNDWWQSSIVQQYGNLMCLLPLKAKFSAKGLGILTATSGWLPTPSATAVNFSVKSETLIDFYIMPENFDSASAYDRVSGNSDYSATIDLCDENGKLMQATYVKGSPYIFTEYGKTQTVYLSAQYLSKIFDDEGNEILANGETLTTDHIGITVVDNDNKDKTMTSKSSYCLTVPQGTKFKNASGKLKITFPNTNGYMSIGTMTKESDLNLYYKHGYAFATDTKVTYNYDDSTADVTSNYEVITKLMRSGFSNTTIQCMLPHQWKYSNMNQNAMAIYTSVRGDMKAVISNTFSTQNKFAGLMPTFARPTNGEFDTGAAKEYLEGLKSSTSNLNPGSDAYWEGKNIHPLGMGVLMADQIGDLEARDLFLSRLKKILVNWFNYDGPDDKSFFIYDENWGTLYYKQSEFGANTSIADHHFTYGYFLFGSTILATYNSGFLNDYREMIELLVRDYGNYEDDELFCKFRNYDLYEGHSWAGGYANNDSGNNQESASEALFSWVGMYLWGTITGNDKYRDAGVFGFTNEMEAVEQYWFNYDKDNWIEDYPYDVVSQVYGGTNFFGTFFGGQPLYCYGIQWLPVGEYLTYYGMDQNRCAEIYQSLLDDTQTAIDKSVLNAQNQGKTEEEIESIRNNYKTPDNGWQHITWSYLSMTNPDLALNKFINKTSSVQKGDQANTYWYMNSMKESGYKTTDVYATGDICATVYYNNKNNKYTAMAWNPTGSEKTVTYHDADGIIGTAKVGAKSLIKFTVPNTKNFVVTQTATPVFTMTDFNGDNKQIGVSGNVEVDDNRFVTISASDNQTIIYYTTDGSTPTTESKIYTEPILVASDTNITAIAVKNNEINSTYANLNITVNGTPTSSGINLALNKDVTVSSVEGATTGGEYITDGKTSTRWSSKFTNEQWCYIDLGQQYPINSVSINWQNSYGKLYEIQISNDAVNWTTVATVTNSSSGVKETEFDSIQARYVKMNGIERGSIYGYSIWEMEVYGANVADAPSISPISGSYETSQRITMNTAVKGAEIKYTTDGSEPGTNSKTYTGPFTVNDTTVIKAITYRKGMALSDVTTSVVTIGNSFAINCSSLTITESKTATIIAYTGGLQDKTVLWESSDDSIAAVNNGVVTAKRPGKATITAKAGGFTKECVVTVIQAVHLESIELSITKVQIETGKDAMLKVIYNPVNSVDDLTVSWKSSDESVATVIDGKVTALKTGTTIITAKVGKFEADCEVTVTVPEAQKPTTPPGVIVRNPSPNVITVTWGRVTGCTYNVYIDGKLVDRETGCYTHTYTDISAGIHTVSITSVNEDKIESTPAIKTIEVLSDILPTTFAPTTIASTTAVPITVSPTTVNPTTSNKPTQAPTTVIPTTMAPTTIDTTTIIPTTSTSEEITTTEEPSTDEPTVGPTTVEPTPEIPTSEEVTTKIPQIVTPTTAEPTAKVTTVKVGKTKITKLITSKKRVKVYVSKVKGVKGYEIKCSTSKKFERKKTKTLSTKKVQIIFSKISKNKKYYFKVRAYKIVDKRKKFGAWSKVKILK